MNITAEMHSAVLGVDHVPTRARLRLAAVDGTLLAETPGGAR